MISLLPLSYCIETKKINKELRLEIRSKLSELDLVFISTSETNDKTSFYLMFNSEIKANGVLKVIHEAKQVLKTFDL